jgi:aryl-alcohol dehydrogenase
MEITAAVLNEVGAEFTLQPVQLNGPRPDEVLVELAAVGICHTDIAVRDGLVPFPMPSVLGHEGSGTVVATGSAVRSVAPGDQVTMSFSSCGACSQCRTGHPAHCGNFPALNFAGARPDGSAILCAERGPLAGAFFGQSSFATHAITHERNLVPVPNGFPLTLAAPLGCGVQTGAGAVMRSFAAPAGSSMLVLGAGSVGLSAVLGAVVQDCNPIIVVETRAERRDLALALGADYAIDPADGSIAEQIRALLPAGVDFGLDTTGVVSVIAQAVSVLGNQGVLGLVAIPAAADPAASNEVAVLLMQNMALGLTLKAIAEGDSDPQVFIPHLMQLHQDGRFPFDRIVSTQPFIEINEAVAAQYRGDGVKVVLVFD